MLQAAVKALAGILSVCAISSGSFSYASCSVDVVIVNGRVEHALPKSRVRVQLVFAKQNIGESGDATVEGGVFRIQIPFYTQSRASFLNGGIPREKCDRKPKTVVVTLIEADQEYDRVSLDLTKDFKMADPSAYALRSVILLHGPGNTPPIR